MKFSTYDILSALVPGFVVFLALIHNKYIDFNKDLLIPFTGLAFIIGYFVNTLSSWVEYFLFITWRGKPSNELLKGKSIWKVDFYSSNEVRDLLIKESGKDNAKHDELFQIAMRYSAGNEKISELNAHYTFSRAILMTVLICICIFVSNSITDFRIYFIGAILLFVAWLRCKQRGYYFAREVLNFYIKEKTSDEKS